MNQLSPLKQWSMSMEEYRQKMKLLVMSVNIKEPRKTITRFFNGLDSYNRNRVNLLPYNDLNELVQLCVKVEQQYAQYYTPSQPNNEFKR